MCKIYMTTIKAIGPVVCASALEVRRVVMGGRGGAYGDQATPAQSLDGEVLVRMMSIPARQSPHPSADQVSVG